MKRREERNGLQCLFGSNAICVQRKRTWFEAFKSFSNGVSLFCFFADFLFPFELPTSCCRLFVLFWNRCCFADMVGSLTSNKGTSKEEKKRKWRRSLVRTFGAPNLISTDLRRGLQRCMCEWKVCVYLYTLWSDKPNRRKRALLRMQNFSDEHIKHMLTHKDWLTILYCRVTACHQSRVVHTSRLQ